MPLTMVADGSRVRLVATLSAGALCAGVSAGLWATPLARAGGEIHGRVLAVAEGQAVAAVPGASVFLNSSGGTSSVTVDSDGRFAFHDLPGDRYTLTATGAGFLPIDFGAFRSGEPGTPIALADGQSIAADVRLTPEGIIAGVVRTADGAPAPSVAIIARTPAGPVGRAVISDSAGAYRIGRLAPGSYVISTTTVRPTTTSTLPTFYPGTSHSEAAATIDLGPGETREGIDFVVPSPGTGSLAGHVFGPDGMPLAGANVIIGTLAEQVRRVSTDAVGGFAMGLLPGGSYPLRLTWDDFHPVKGVAPLEAARAALALRPTLWAQQVVEVADGAPTNVSIRLRGTMSMSGRLVPRSDNDTRVVLRLTRIDAVEPELTANVTGDDFTIRSILPGTYRLTASSPDDSRWWLSSADDHGDSMLAAPIVFQASDGDRTGIVITMSTARGSLAGRVTDSSGRAATAFWVVAFPTDRRAWEPDAPNLRRIRPATDGTFALPNLPAGEYFVAACGDMGPGDWQQPLVLDSIGQAAMRITLRDGQALVRDLRVAR